jgi:hypothetical protein
MSNIRLVGAYHFESEWGVDKGEVWCISTSCQSMRYNDYGCGRIQLFVERRGKVDTQRPAVG